jgi:adenylate cyclase class 2
MADAGLEIEIKLAGADRTAARRLLRRAGARGAQRVRERNTLFDTRERDLGRTGRVLRVRTVERVAGGEKAGTRALKETRKNRPLGILTVKTPVEQAEYKVRREIETVVQDPERVEQMLASVGFEPWFRYEKFRTTYRLPGFQKLVIDLDETPVGVYFELEGPRSQIDRAARKLGYGPGDYLTASYYELFLSARRRLSLPEDAMVFPEPVKTARAAKK